MLVAIFPRVNGGHLGFSSFQLYLYIARRFTATFRDNIETPMQKYKHTFIFT